MNNNRRLDKIESRLTQIEKYLTNHLAHQKILTDRWIKVYLPTAITLAPAIAEGVKAILRLSH